MIPQGLDFVLIVHNGINLLCSCNLFILHGCGFYIMVICILQHKVFILYHKLLNNLFLQIQINMFVNDANLFWSLESIATSEYNG